MVKRIKKRVTKPEPTPEELALEGEESPEVIVDEGAGEGADELPPPSFAVEPNISMSYQDGFTEVAERIFVSVVDHWKVLAALAVITAGVWGVSGKMQDLAHAGLAEERAQLSATARSYDQATAAQRAFAKQNVRWFSENPDALTTPEVGPAPSTESLKSVSKAYSDLKGSLSHDGARTLAQLGEASARFDSATSAEDFKVAGELFMTAGAQRDADPMARATAFQSAAASFEQAREWDQAVKAWAALGALDTELVKASAKGERVVFALFAGVEQAKVLIEAGKKTEAKALLGSLEKDYAEALKDTANKSVARELKVASLRAK